MSSAAVVIGTLSVKLFLFRYIPDTSTIVQQQCKVEGMSV